MLQVVGGNSTLVYKFIYLFMYFWLHWVFVVGS